MSYITQINRMGGALDVEALGSVYESLLDYHPVVHPESNSLKFDLRFA